MVAGRADMPSGPLMVHVDASMVGVAAQSPVPGQYTDTGGDGVGRENLFSGHPMMLRQCQL